MKTKKNLKSTKFLWFIAGLLFITLLSQCKKDQLEVSPINSSSSYLSLNDFFLKQGVKSQFFTIDQSNANDTYITGKNGTKIVIPQNAFVDTFGPIVSDKIQIELKEILSKSDMILSDQSSSCFGQILESAGEVFIEARVNGKKIQLAEEKMMEISIPFKTALYTPYPDMMLYLGDNSNGSFTWFPDADTLFRDHVKADGKSNTYNIFLGSNEYSWINCARFYMDRNDRTPLTIKPTFPLSSDTIDSRLFLVFNDIHSVMNAYMNADHNFFTYKIPIGMNVTLVGIGIGKKKIYFGKKVITIKRNHLDNLEFVEASPEAIKKELDGL